METVLNRHRGGGDDRDDASGRLRRRSGYGQFVLRATGGVCRDAVGGSVAVAGPVVSILPWLSEQRRWHEFSEQCPGEGGGAGRERERDCGDCGGGHLPVVQWWDAVAEVFGRGCGFGDRERAVQSDAAVPGCSVRAGG